MWPIIKKFQYKSAGLIYGFVFFLAVGLILQNLQCDSNLCKIEDWFPRFGALLVCYSLVCVYLNHYLGPIQTQAVRNAKSAKQLRSNSGQAVNAAVDFAMKLELPSQKRKFRDHLGEQVNLAKLPIEGTDKSVLEFLQDSIRESATAKAEKAIDELVDDSEEEAQQVGGFRNLLTVFEFVAAICGTFVWGFGDFVPVQVVVGCMVFIVCLLRCLPSFDDVFRDSWNASPAN